MIEHDNVRDALKEMYEISEASGLHVDGKAATVEDVQELFKERLYNLMDLLGHENIYLSKKEV